MSSLKRFFANAALLTLSALIMRSIAVSFGAYVSNTAGAEAMGLFSLIMSVFGFALTLATSGVNLAVTRMVSEALGSSDDGLALKSMRKCVLYCMICSIFAGGVLFVFAPAIGNIILRDTRTILSLRILALSLPFISLTSAYNGYFTAVRRVYKNTIYSVSEQLIKIYFTVKFFELYIHKGVEYACIAMIAADAISEFSAFVMSFIMYYFDKKRHIKRNITSVNDTVVTKKLYSIAIPVAISTYIRSGLLTIEHILIPKGLMKSGLLNSEALASYGMLHSMVMPVVLFPTAVLSSFSGLLIPELAEASVKNKKAPIQNIASRALSYSLIFSFGISGFLMAFSGELGMIIYDSAEVSKFIRLMAPLVPVMYLDSVTDAMLKGLGHQVYSMNVNIIDALLSIICVIVLLPRFGMKGYVITIYITELINASLSISKLISATDLRPKILRWIFAPLISVIGASAFGRLIFGIINTPVSVTGEVVLDALVMLFIYIFLINITGALNRRDRAWLKYALGKRPKKKIRRYSEVRCEARPSARIYSAPLQK
ncbi:MAG: oligosaccharide flippase family protein [Clostridia bacterium]|nr:oligosaccharide flippase family protein [Clostridia bacterium]